MKSAEIEFMTDMESESEIMTVKNTEVGTQTDMEGDSETSERRGARSKCEEAREHAKRESEVQERE